ncbi:MAG: AAA family ATPase [Comamonadaceae bacterium]|nr:AAA family ATPase [Comamonadaceae bacterium]
MFDTLILEGLRGVGRVELRFQPGSRVRTLLGANGVGKTKCLEAIYQWLLLTQKWAREPGRFIRSEHIVVQAIQADGLMRFERPEATSFLGELAGEPHDVPVLLLGARGRSDLDVEQNVQSTLGAFEQRRKNYLDQAVNLIDRGGLACAGMSANVRNWFVLRAQSVNPYQKKEDNRKIEIDTVLQMLHEVDERIDAHFLQIDGAGRVFLKVEGQERALDELSSGFASLLKLVQAIVAAYASFTNEPNLRHVPGVVLIDEIESHLHASWQARIIPALKRLLPNTTFYIATHSPLVLSQLQEGEAYLLQRDADGVVRTQLIDSPNRRAFVDVLDDTLGVDLNALKHQAMPGSDQTLAKQRLRELLTHSPGGRR